MAEQAFPNTIPDEFWKIIQDARQDRMRLRVMLKMMSRSSMIHFFWTYEELANRLRTEEYWPHVHPDLSEDGLAELANWVVAQGREYYSNILHHPELIPPKQNDPGLLSEIIDEYEQRYQDDLPMNTYYWDEEWKQHGKKGPWSLP